MFAKIKLFIKKHYLAIIIAVVAGIISVAPEFLYIRYLGSDYKGGPFLPTANEEIIVTRMHEIIEGHWRVGSPIFFEYKSNYPLMPPVGEYFYALPSLLFNISLIKIIIFSKFLFPALLFFLVYFLIYQLSFNKESVSVKFNAAVGGLFVVLGYDLIDYQSVLRYLNGGTIINFSVWTRPVNPIGGALFIFILLLITQSIISQRKKYLFIPAGLVLALMVGYFFSWGISLSVIAVLVGLYLLRKDFFVVKQFGLIIIVALLASSFYWFNLGKSLLGPGNENLAAKNGMFYTHTPMVNKALLLTTLLFFLLTLHKLWRRENIKSAENEWWWFCSAMILGSWLAYNQQIITGRTIWPYHFVQYSIPFCIVVGMLMLANFLRLKFFKAWVVIIALILLSVLAYNVKAFMDYPKRYETARFEQDYVGLINWLNKNAPKECVVLINDPTGQIGYRITALTHCDLYSSNWVFENIPAERIYHNYFVSLKLMGIRSDQVGNYLIKNMEEVKVNFFTDWKQMYSLTTDDDWLYMKISQISLDYKNFYQRDFSKELRKYRLDYIISAGQLDERFIQELKAEAVFDNSGWYIYKLNF